MSPVAPHGDRDHTGYCCIVGMGATAAAAAIPEVRHAAQNVIQAVSVSSCAWFK
jgi:hypothetical protein